MKKVDVKDVREIEEFLGVVSQDPSINLNKFYENLRKCEVYELSKKELKGYGSETGDAAYEYVENQIYITSKSQKLKSIFHELFHMASTIRIGNVVYNGFLCCNLDNEEYIGRGLNEGFTELLAERYFDLGTGYHYERMLTRQVEKIVGEQCLKDNYFTSNLNSIIKKMASYSSEEEAKQFIEDFDNFVCFRTGMEDRKVVSLQSVMYNCCRYLIRTYINKLQADTSCAENYKNQLFNYFIGDFDFGCIEYDGCGKVDMHEIMKKIGEESGMFEIADNHEDIYRK